eukprot:3166760-Pleurochrysis_carterae.AAC.1
MRTLHVSLSVRGELKEFGYFQSDWLTSLTTVRRRPWDLERAHLLEECIPVVEALSLRLKRRSLRSSVSPAPSKLSDDRGKAICCVSLRCDCARQDKSRVAWRGKPTLPKKILIYLL